MVDLPRICSLSLIRAAIYKQYFTSHMLTSDGFKVFSSMVKRNVTGGEPDGPSKHCCEWPPDVEKTRPPIIFIVVN